MAAKRPHKSVALCPNCERPMVFIRPAKKSHVDKTGGEHLICHHTECRHCKTRCRTETHSVIMKTA